MRPKRLRSCPKTLFGYRRGLLVGEKRGAGRSPLNVAKRLSGVKQREQTGKIVNSHWRGVDESPRAAVDQEGLCAGAPGVRNGLRTVVNDKRLGGMKRALRQDALVVQGAGLVRRDEVGAIEASEIAAYAHAVQIAGELVS